MSERAKRRVSRDHLSGSANTPAAVEGGSRPAPAITDEGAAEQSSERQSLGAISWRAARLSNWESEGGGLGPTRRRRAETRSGELDEPPETALPESPAGAPDG